MIVLCRSVKRSQYEQFNDQTTTIDKGILSELFFFDTVCFHYYVEIDNYYHLFIYFCA